MPFVDRLSETTIPPVSEMLVQTQTQEEELKLDIPEVDKTWEEPTLPTVKEEHVMKVDGVHIDLGSQSHI